MKNDAVRLVEFTSKSSILDAHLRQHDANVLGSHCCQWMVGPVSRLIPDLCVIEAKANNSGEYWHYLTSGSSDIDCGRSGGTEFCLKTSMASPLHVELASMVAYMHRDPSHHFDVGHTMKIGRPLIAGSHLDRILVSLPYPYGPNFEYVHLSADRHARILWLLPITSEEESLCHSDGLDYLEQRFEDAGVDFLDPFRQSVA